MRPIKVFARTLATALLVAVSFLVFLGVAAIGGSARTRAVTDGLARAFRAVLSRLSFLADRAG
ncbi:MAG: hypothetical protein HYR98_07220 [Nitrospirae bacterium]|nr:hypothetical protein [Nitrospirota bacterium]MBI3392661.1 hypothetical protein [Nitrospirota bacterium]